MKANVVSFLLVFVLSVFLVPTQVEAVESQEESAGIMPVGVAQTSIVSPPGVSDRWLNSIEENLITSTPDWSDESDQAYAWFGLSVASAGDVNGDGFDDVIVGCPYWDNGVASEGIAFVYHGSVSGLSLTPDWSAESNQYGAHLGSSVAAAGDVNGDGYADVIVGARDYSNGQAGEGVAFVYYGSATGLDLDGMRPSGDPGNADWMAESNSYGTAFGNSVATAGDVNNDGYDDIIVGAYGYDLPKTDSGSAYVYHGSATGLDLNGTRPSGDRTNADWIGVKNLLTSYYGSHFGSSVATAGDVNGDGFADIIVGAEWYYSNRSGEAFVYHGSATGLPAQPDWVADPDDSPYVGAHLGASVASAGDINGDGYDDVIIGAPDDEQLYSSEGRVIVYHGSPAGLGASEVWTRWGNEQNADLGRSVASAGDVNDDGYADVITGANGLQEAFVYYGSGGGLNAVADHILDGDSTGEFGWSVATAGDVNGDGAADVIVGDYTYDNGQVNEGAAFVYQGTPSKADLIVASIMTDPEQPWPYEPFAVNVTFKNQGTKDIVGLFRNGYVLTPPISLWQYWYSFNLSAGATVTRQFDYPSGRAPGTYTIQACADTSGWVSEFDEDNNCLTAYLVMEPVVEEPPVIDDMTFADGISELCQSSGQVTAHDPEGGILSYSWTPLDGGAIIGTGASVTFDPPDSGPHPCPYRVKVTVASSVSGLSTSQTTGITVKLAGDVDGSGVVNVLDKLQVRNHFGESGAPGWIDADVNCDGSVNVLDKLKVRDQFGQSGCAIP